MMKSGNRSFACRFCLDFSRNIAKQTNRSKGMYKGNRRKEVCRLFGRQKHIARHRKYRHVLNLRLRCRQKNEKTLTVKKLPTHCIIAEKIPYFGITASAKVVTAKK